ncbi:hypothetical protein [Halobaculum lipolyticum]|uniref:Uncharacterized protein n=1 Tax=Halobaculum lipolyticum TaxID=3032001 RepID=A0ABD5WBG2_9EURY|nr:hypothetical protein [Halobaculum sp. DT31]
MSDDATGAGGDAGTSDDHAELREPVATFLGEADDVYDEYDKGYVDADAALSVLASSLADLRAAADGAEAPDDGE